MLRRFRQLLVFCSLGLLLLLLGLWAAGDVVILRSLFHVDARCHVMVDGASLHIDHTGLYYLLRDLRQANQIDLAVDRHANIPGELLAATGESGPFSVRWRSRYVRRAPLQDLTDSAGRPIYLEQSVPLRLLTVPAWLVAILLAIAPGRSFVRRIRAGRAATVAPFRWVGRHGVAVCTIASILVCCAWIVSTRRIATVYAGVDRTIELSSSGGCVTAMRSNPPSYREDELLGHSGIQFIPYDGRQHSGFVSALSNVSEWPCLSIPYWLLFVLTATVPLTWLAMRLWGRQVLAGHCRQCDYDLRASADRCPECGQPIAERPAVAPSRWRQRTVFASGLALLLLVGVLVFGWCESSNRRCGLLGWMNDKPQSTGFELSIENGLLQLTNPQISPYSPRPWQTCPVWVPTFGLLVVSAVLVWQARRMGQSQLD